MPDSTEAKPGPAIALEIEEVQGLFSSNAALEDAIAALTGSGFDHADLSLPQASPPASQATPEQGAAATTTDTDLRQARTLGAGLAGSVGMAAAAGLTVATGGALAAAAAAGLVGGVGAGAVAETVGNVAATTSRDAREHAARTGMLVLAVRITSPARQARAEEVMRAAGATKIAAVTRTTAAIDWPAGRARLPAEAQANLRLLAAALPRSVTTS